MNISSKNNIIYIYAIHYCRNSLVAQFYLKKKRCVTRLPSTKKKKSHRPAILLRIPQHIDHRPPDHENTGGNVWRIKKRLQKCWQDSPGSFKSLKKLESYSIFFWH